ncbi:MAG: DUF2283 domain-containing protein [Caldilineaceae bacterium SB0675_bin_29]|uniref:DUF2283 domain-containing protein n=1 Tax=Caldilineaceae bacterium SB0675_bin_29 TaxID=2605266 RepID=A0A6B1FW50_9CHLR|nr:DUF2283 domain-containing protein [Caldilineaceae bacterium SB0675_bin_29]
MDVKYFEDTDTLLIDFSDREIVETRDAGEDLLIELDGDGKIVSLTVEHAGERIDVSNVTYVQITASRAWSDLSR